MTSSDGAPVAEAAAVMAAVVGLQAEAEAEAEGWRRLLRAVTRLQVGARPRWESWGGRDGRGPLGGRGGARLGGGPPVGKTPVGKQGGGGRVSPWWGHPWGNMAWGGHPWRGRGMGGVAVGGTPVGEHGGGVSPWGGTPGGGCPCGVDTAGWGHQGEGRGLHSWEGPLGVHSWMGGSRGAVRWVGPGRWCLIKTCLGSRPGTCLVLVRQAVSRGVRGEGAAGGRGWWGGSQRLQQPPGPVPAGLCQGLPAAEAVSEPAGRV